MTIVSQSTKAVAQGNGATTNWPYTFPIPSTDDLIVSTINLATGTTIILPSSAYAVSGIGSEIGGAVTYPLSGTPLSSGFDIVVQRLVPYVQETDLVNQSGAYPQDIEDALDFLTMQTQQLNETLSRTVQFPLSDSAVGVLPPAAARANKIFSFDGAGTPTASALPAGVVAVSAPMIPVVGAASTAAALVALGITGATFGTFALAQAAFIDPGAAYIWLAGHTTPGDLGGGIYYRVVGGSVQLTTADGAQWRLGEPILTPQMFGTVVGGNLSAGYTAAVAAAVALNVRRIFIPAGNYFMDAQGAYSSAGSVVSTFAAGIEVWGAGENATIIDNRVVGATPMLSFSSGTASFQNGTYIHDFSITNSTGVVGARGIEIHALYNSLIQRVHIFNNNIGGQMTCLVGDSDASNSVVWDMCRFENGTYGIYSNFAAGVTQVSFTRVTNSFFTGQVGGAGWYYIGLQGSCINCAFAALTCPGIQFINNGSANNQFVADTLSFENCGTPSLQINSLTMGLFRNIEIANTLPGPFPATQGILVNACYGVRFTGIYVRILAAYNPYTLIALAAGAIYCQVENVVVNAFDATGQVRFTDAGIQNRVFDDSMLIGSYNGVVTIACTNGANNDKAVPNDGEFYTTTGPTGVFNITGLTNGFNGRRLILHNTSGFALTITSNSAGSAVLNRILTNNNVDATVQPNGHASLVYATSRWHLLSVG